MIIWLILGMASLAIFILFFNHASPTASIDIKIGKEDAVKKAADFIESQGFDLRGYDKTVIFYSDYDASVYLQYTQGIKRTNELILREIPVWYWRVRWFKELEKKGFVVGVNPSTGEIVRFYYSVLDDEESTSLTESRARQMAEEKIENQGIDLKDYALKDSTTKKQKKRTDYYFEWEKRDYKIEDATLRVGVDIYGDKIGLYKIYLKVPEAFSRYLDREISFGRALTMISSIFIFLLTIIAIFVLIVHYKQIKGEWKWKFGLIAACIVFPVEIFAFFNRMPLQWSFYPDTISKFTFIIMSLERALLSATSIGLMIFAYGTVGELLSSHLWKNKIPLISALKNKNYSASEITPVFIVGYSLGFLFLGYITLFYLIGMKFFNIWIPPDTEYSNILGTAMPFLFPLTIAVSSAIREEFMYRLFAISFLKKSARLTWLALFLPALFWGFAHSNYPIFPNYVRGIELTIFGIILGIAFLKYGLETVIIAHFVINASLVGLPLLKSHNPYFIVSGLIIISLALIPILILIPLIKLKLKNKNYY